MKSLVIKPSFFFVVNLLFFSKTYLYSHDARYDKLRNAKLPEAYFSGERFQELTSNTRNLNETEKIEQIEKALEEYYSQFYEEKRIEHDKKSKAYFDKKEKREVSFYYRSTSGKILPSSNVNDIRVFHAENKSLFGPSFLIRDSETLHTLHFELGNLYNQANQKHKAMEHFLAAFRYVDFTLSEESLETLNTREFLDTEAKSKLQIHFQKKQEYEKAKQDYIQTIDEFHKNQAEELRSSLANKTFFQPRNLDTKPLEEKLKQKEQEYQTSLNENYLPMLKKRNENLANKLFRFAKLTKEMEINEKTYRYVKEAYPIHEINFKDFPSFLQILEFANRLAPENPEVLYHIAEEYRSISKKKEALTYYLKYDSLPKERFSEKPKEDVSLKIASLYTELKQPVLAVSFYERHFENLDEGKKQSFAFVLGDFFEKRIGNLEKSYKYYKQFLEKENLEKENSLYQSIVANLGISKFYKQSKNPKLEEEHLEKAYQSYKLLEGKLLSKEKEIEKQKEEVSRLKKGLLYNTDEDVLNDFRERQNNLSLEIENWKSIKNFYDKAPKIDLLYRLTKLCDEKRDYKKEKEYFREILNFGGEAEISFALKNLERIQKIEQDGLYRAYIEK